MKGQLITALGIVMSAGSLVPAIAVPTPPQTNVFSPGVVVSLLSCSVNQTTQSLHITNTDRLRSTFKAGSRVVWSGSQGQQGEFNLASDLAPLKTIDVKVNSKFNNCQAAAVK